MPVVVTNASLTSMMASGQSLQEIADAQPPLRPRGLALAIICLCATFLTLATAAVSLRIYCRLWARRSLRAQGWDDLLAVLGLGAYGAICGFSILGSLYGIGNPAEEFELGTLLRGVQYSLRGEVSYVFAISLVKTSVGLGILRLAFEQSHRRAIIFLIVGSNLIYIGSLICIFILCTSLWKMQMVATCTNSWVPYILVWMGMALSAISDAAFAIIPVMLVRRLTMPPRTKRSLMCVFAVGSLGAVASAVRFPFLPNWVQLSPNHPETMYKSGWIPLFGVVEVGIGLVAGSLPYIGKMFHFFGSAEDDVPVMKLADKTIGGTPQLFKLADTQPSKGTFATEHSGGSQTAVHSPNTGSDGLFNHGECGKITDNVTIRSSESHQNMGDPEISHLEHSGMV